MENNSTSSKELFDMSTSSSIEGGEDIAETSQRSTNSPKVSKQLVGKVLRSAVRRLDSEPSLKSDFGVTAICLQATIQKPKRPRSKKSTFRRQSPRRANTDIRGTLRPSTYFHIPSEEKLTAAKKIQTFKKQGQKRRRGAVIFGSYDSKNGVTIASGQSTGETTKLGQNRGGTR